eukprot:1827313-Rhodomonas_salina.1
MQLLFIVRASSSLAPATPPRTTPPTAPHHHHSESLPHVAERDRDQGRSLLLFCSSLLFSSSSSFARISGWEGAPQRRVGGLQWRLASAYV